MTSQTYSQENQKQNHLKNHKRPNLDYENKFKKKFKYICGVDEVGLGPIAGPVIASAVILKKNFANDKVNDSKKISEKKRYKIYDELINDENIIFSWASASVKEIENINILEAKNLASIRAVKKLKKCDFILIDGNKKLNLKTPQKTIVKGDQISLSIATASIIAKVTRDKIMIRLAKLYDKYSLEKNKGYPTKQHLKALNQYGYSSIHRKTFKPVFSCIKKHSH